MNYNRIRYDFCNSDIHTASYSRHLKSKKHLEIMTQNVVSSPRKNPIKTVVKEDIKVSGIKAENQYYFTDRIIKLANHIFLDTHTINMQIHY